MNRITFLITLFCLAVTICHAQSSDDEKYEQANKYYMAHEYDKSMLILEELATKNHAKALDMLGFCYDKGHGVSKNRQKAIGLYQKSANLGWKVGQLHLAYSYLENEDLQLAATWFKKAADAGSYTALYELGVMYECGEYFDQDIDTAHDYYLKAAENGYYPAQIKLAWLYQDEEYQIRHENILEDKLNSMTEKWLREAAKQKPDGLFELASYYDIHSNLYEDKRTPSPESMYKKAAEAGSGKAQAMMGNLYLYEHKYDEALSMYLMAKDNGVKKTRCFALDTQYYTIESLIMLSKFLKSNTNYELIINHGRGIVKGSFCCWEDGKVVIIYVKKDKNRNGYLKLSQAGKILGTTGFKYENQFGEYLIEYKAFLIDNDKYIDMTGKIINVPLNE